jgi:uroporphyrinogen decarboxylase
VDKYSHRERLNIILAGEKPDRFAASFWRHFYHREHYAEGTAEAMLSFQKRFDWDFIKINPRAEYHNEGWGLKVEWSHDEFAKHKKIAFPVTAVADWDKVEPLKLSTPVLAEHLKVVSLVRKGVGKEVPVLMTVFTPVAVAGRMLSEQKDLVEHLHQKPQKVVCH